MFRIVRTCLDLFEHVFDCSNIWASGFHTDLHFLPFSNQEVVEQNVRQKGGHPHATQCVQRKPAFPLDEDVYFVTTHGPIHCILYIVYCTQYIVYCVLCTVY